MSDEGEEGGMRSKSEEAREDFPQSCSLLLNLSNN